MSEAEFWRTTPRFFAARVKAWEGRMKHEFDRLRTATFLTCSPYLKKNISLNRFWPSPWHVEKKIDWQPIDPAVLANFERNADDVLAQMKQARTNGDN